MTAVILLHLVLSSGPSAAAGDGSPALAGPDPQVLSLADEAVQCAAERGLGVGARRLAVIDYSRPSLEPRLWVYELPSHRLLYTELVAHGKGSGGDVATAFSNAEGSRQSSLGLFLTGEAYVGGNGYSLRLRGLEPGVNDRAMARAVVIHGAPYVDPQIGRRLGRLGRSWGCPAVRPQIARPLIDTLKGGSFVFAYYPDPAWLSRSTFLGCRKPARAAARDLRKGSSAATAGTPAAPAAKRPARD